MDIEEAKAYLRDNYEKGCVCPCCNQHVQVYNRKLNSGMAITLIRIYKNVGNEWVHVKEFLRTKKFSNSHDWTLLRHWDLLEEKDEKCPDQKCSGIWRITRKGIDFVRGKIEVPKFFYMYNKKAHGFSDEFVNINDCLGDRFSYSELMGIDFNEAKSCEAQMSLI